MLRSAFVACLLLAGPALAVAASPERTSKKQVSQRQGGAKHSSAQQRGALKHVSAQQHAPRQRNVAGPSPASLGTPYGAREDVMRFAEDVAARRGLDGEWLRDVLAQAQYMPAIPRLVQPPVGAAPPKSWRMYRSRFIDAVRVGAGVKFWRAHRDTLARAEMDFGVPPEIVVGIIGVETIFGQQMGNYRVLDALATLAFDFPTEHPRAADRTRYFRAELEQFLVTHAGAGTSPLMPRGSYAGAMGMPQFMPSSIARWAVDYDGDYRVDLQNSPQDVIGSVANYFRSHGWKPGMPTHYPVRFDFRRLDLMNLLAPDILPTFSASVMQEKGAMLDGGAREHEGPLALVELLNGGDPPQYIAGTENFYVVTRYNWSSFYAMAVIELGREVRQALEKQVASGHSP